MPYSQEHKQETRERIIESARKLFNSKGFSEVTIDEIMEEAGLTRGGFYNHFKAKDELFVEAIEAFGKCNPADRWENIELDFSNDASTVMKQMINAYLSQEHLDNLESHCPLIALSSDISRESAIVKAAYQQVIEGMANMFETGLSSSTNAESRSRSLALVSLCIGGMIVARTLNDENLASEVRLAVRNFALMSADLGH